MPWPNDALSTESLDSNTDKPSRTLFLTLVNTVKSMIAGRGRPNGVAPLDGDGRVPTTNLPRGLADGVAPLNEQRQVPGENLPLGIAGGGATLDANGKVELSQLPVATNTARGIVALDDLGKVKAVDVSKSQTGAGQVTDISIGALIDAAGILHLSLHLTLSPPAESSPDDTQDTQNTQNTQATGDQAP